MSGHWEWAVDGKVRWIGDWREASPGLTAHDYGCPGVGGDMDRCTCPLVTPSRTDRQSRDSVVGANSGQGTAGSDA